MRRPPLPGRHDLRVGRKEIARPPEGASERATREGQTRLGGRRLGCLRWGDDSRPRLSDRVRCGGSHALELIGRQREERQHGRDDDECQPRLRDAKLLAVRRDEADSERADRERNNYEGLVSDFIPPYARLNGFGSAPPPKKYASATRMAMAVAH